MTAQDINDYLDKLSTAFDNQAKQQLMHEVIKCTSLVEQKWFVRLVLKDLKIGMSHTVILKHYHREALDLFNSTSDLKETCSQLDNLDTHTAKDTTLTKLFFAIRPMLASKLTPNLIQHFVKDKTCLVETKYDGERI